MNLEELKSTMASYFNEDDSRVGISVIAETGNDSEIEACTSLHGNPVILGAVLAYVMHEDEEFARIIRNAVTTLEKVKFEDVEKSHNS